jgi:hypothetical protein
MTIVNGWIPPDGFPEKRDYYEDFFYNKVLHEAPRTKTFQFHTIYKTFGYEWNSLEQNWLNIVSQEIKIRLINDGFIKQELQGGTEYRITEKGRNERDGVNPYANEVHNYHAPVIQGSIITNSLVSQGSSLDSITQISTTQAAPIIKEPKSKWDNLSKLIIPILVKIFWGISAAVALYFGYELLG